MKSLWTRFDAFVAQRAAVLLVAATLYVCVMLTVSLLVLWPQPHVAPIRSASFEILSPEVPQGGFLRLRFTVDKIRICEAHGQQFIMSDNGVVDAVLPSLGTMFGLGQQTRVMSFRLPRELRPGTYRYELLVMHECRSPSGSFLTPVEGDGRFEVVAP